MLHEIAKWIAGGLIAIASFFNPAISQQSIDLGAANNAVGGKLYFLSGSGVSASQTTIGLTTLTIAGGTQKLTMTDFGALGCGTVEPGHATRQEFVSFTGVTQNSDGTATLTGVSRGLAPIPPYTASTTQQKAHAGGSQFVISNSPPCFYENYLNLTTVSTSTNILIFSSTTPPRLDQPGAQSTGTHISTTSEFATVAYVNATGAGVIVNSTETIKGSVELATQLQMASSTLTDTTGASLGLYTKYSTSSPYTTGLLIPITRNDGKLSPLFIATTSSDVYNFGGAMSFNGTNMFTASTTYTATTTFNGSSVTNNALIINNLPYSFPSTRAASSTVLNENGSGVLSWQPPAIKVLAAKYLNTSSTGATTTVATVILPANSLGATNGWLTIKTNWNNTAAGQTGQIDIGDGSATTTAVFISNNPGAFDMYTTDIMPVSATTQNVVTGATGQNGATFINSTTTNANVSSQLYLAFRIRTTDASALTLRSYMVTLFTP